MALSKKEKQQAKFAKLKGSRKPKNRTAKIITRGRLWWIRRLHELLALFVDR